MSLINSEHTTSGHAQASFEVEKIREQFPVLHQDVNGKPLVYFDNAATSQKPRRVIDAINDYYSNYNSNIHRGIHTLADRATNAFESTREKLTRFINAPGKEQIIFTKGTTEGVNLVSTTFERSGLIQKGDEILVSGMEHHSNIVPWQILCERTGATLKVIPVHENGELDIEAFREKLTAKTKLVAVVLASNTLGTINPVEEIIDDAHQNGSYVLVDGAQSVAHLQVDVQKLDCDFLVFSGHKMFGPTGIGVLYGKADILEGLTPYQGGGEMIDEVDFAGTTYNVIPYKFEAGTPNIADVIALGSAVDFIEEIGVNNIQSHEENLLRYAMDQMESIPGLKIYGQAPHKVGIISFVLESVHHFDIGMMLDAKGVAIRTGHHCTQPLMKSFGIDGTARASFAVYNTEQEVDTFAEGLARIAKMGA